MPGQPDENYIFNQEVSSFGYSIEDTDDSTAKALKAKFPELVRANGDVDPMEALVTLVDKIEDIDTRLKGVG